MSVYEYKNYAILVQSTNFVSLAKKKKQEQVWSTKTSNKF